MNEFSCNPAHVVPVFGKNPPAPGKRKRTDRPTRGARQQQHTTSEVAHKAAFEEKRTWVDLRPRVDLGLWRRRRGGPPVEVGCGDPGPGGGLLLLARGRGLSESTCGRLSEVAPAPRVVVV